MVKKSICITLLLLVLYTLAIKLFKPTPVAQQQFQQNLINAQNYVYNDSAKKLDVIVGTSISAGIKIKLMPGGMYSLAFAGQSIYDGLALIENAKAHPKYIFIEENSILTPERPDFITCIFNPVNYYRKKYFVCMDDSYQPAGQTYKLIANHAQGAIKRFTTYVLTPAIHIFDKGKAAKVNTDDFYAEEKRRNQKVDTAVVKAAFEKLKERVSLLEKGGSKICFYAVPADAPIYNGKLARTIRQLFPIYFPRSTYSYIPEPNIAEYHTYDQIHMVDTSCVRFTHYMAKQVNAIRKTNN